MKVKVQDVFTKSQIIKIARLSNVIPVAGQVGLVTDASLKVSGCGAASESIVHAGSKTWGGGLRPRTACMMRAAVEVGSGRPVRVARSWVRRVIVPPHSARFVCDFTFYATTIHHCLVARSVLRCRTWLHRHAARRHVPSRSGRSPATDRMPPRLSFQGSR